MLGFKPVYSISQFSLCNGRSSICVLHARISGSGARAHKLHQLGGGTKAHKGSQEWLEWHEWYWSFVATPGAILGSAAVDMPRPTCRGQRAVAVSCLCLV